MNFIVNEGDLFMEVNSSKKAEQFMQFQLLTEMFKEAAGDNPSFQLMMEGLLQSVTDSQGNLDFSRLGLEQMDLDKLGYSAQERITNVYNDVSSSVKSGNSSIDQAVEKASRKYGIGKDLIMAVIKQESSFDPYSVSKAGAEGLMQLMPGTAKDLGVKNSFNIEENVDGGTRYLRDMLDIYNNSKQLALAAYNAGPGTLKRKGVDTVDEISNLSSETRDYVQKVMKYEALYKQK